MQSAHVRPFRALAVVVALTLVIGGVSPAALAQTVSAEEVAAAEADAAAATEKLDAARSQLADA